MLKSVTGFLASLISDPPGAPMVLAQRCPDCGDHLVADADGDPGAWCPTCTAAQDHHDIDIAASAVVTPPVPLLATGSERLVRS